MVKYLQMDGVDDKLTISGTFGALTEFIATVKPRPQSWEQYINFGGKQVNRSGSNTDQFHTDYQAIYVDGASVSTNTAFIKIDTKQVFRGVLKAGITTGTTGTNVFWNGGSAYMEGDIYDIKLYNGTTLVAHYDMSTGTVQDQSGNGYHATLTGGTWMDDGAGGTDPGTNGSTLFDVKQVIYQDSALTADTKQSLYADESLTTDLLQRIYSGGYVQADTEQSAYHDGATTLDTSQVIYEASTLAFDMLQTYFEDGQTGATPFDMRIVYYADGSKSIDTKQTWYEESLSRYDMAQFIYETSSTVTDMRAVIYADGTIVADTKQALYTDGSFDADTLQQLLAEWSEYREVIRITLEITQRQRNTLEIVQHQTIELNL